MRMEIEVTQIDRKHEGHRMKSEAVEKKLLAAIVSNGIEEPLSGVREGDGGAILLDGFKRLRVAIKVGIQIVPFIFLAEDEVTGIVQMIRVANAKQLSLLEQAAFVEDLKNVHGLSVAQISQRLQKSKAWVLVRLRTQAEMSPTTRSAILSGNFPFYSYFYTLHPFMRVSGIASKKDIDEFVSLTAAKGLSTRDIELLASAYFRGGNTIRAQLKNGDLSWCLEELKARNRESQGADDLSDVEKKILRDLEIVQGAMGRLVIKTSHPDVEAGIKKPNFNSCASVLVEGVLSRNQKFVEVMRGFYDRLRQT